MSNQNQSEFCSKEWTLEYSWHNKRWLVITEPIMGHRDDGYVARVVPKSDYDKLKEENQRLRGEVEFVKQYLNPADTSFRQMIDTFKCLPKEKQEKLIDLSRSLVNLGGV